MYNPCTKYTFKFLARCEPDLSFNPLSTNEIVSQKNE